MDQVKADKFAAVGLGVLFILIGVVVNPYTVSLLTSDGKITSSLLKAVILGTESVMMLIGAWILFKRPKGSLNISLSIGSVVLMLVAAEAFSITTGIFLPRGSAELDRFVDDTLQPDPVLGYKMKPNMKEVPVSWDEASLTTAYSSDQYGFRNVGRDYASAPLFFIGDSFTFGAWVDREKTFVGLSEEAMGKPAISLGVGGYGVAQYRLLTNWALDQFNPEMIVLCIFANDLRALPSPETLNHYYHHMGWDKAASVPLVQKSFLYQLSQLFLKGMKPMLNVDQKKGSNGLTLRNFGGAGVQYFADSLYLDLEESLSAIIDTVEARNRQLMVLLIPSKESTYIEEYKRLFSINHLSIEQQAYARICQLARAKEVPCLDLTLPFRQNADQHTLYFDVDSHWNEQGHALAAKEIMRHIQEIRNPAMP